MYYGVVKLLFRNKVVVEQSKLILSKASTCKLVYFLENVCAGACKFTKNQLFEGNFEDLSKLWVSSYNYVLYIRHLYGLLKLLQKRKWRSFFFSKASGW